MKILKKKNWLTGNEVAKAFIAELNIDFEAFS